MQKFFLSLGVAALIGVSVWAFSQWMEVQQTTEDVNKAAEISSRAEKDTRHDDEEAKRLSLELEKVENMRQQESLELKETLEEGQELKMKTSLSLQDEENQRLIADQLTERITAGEASWTQQSSDLNQGIQETGSKLVESENAQRKEEDERKELLATTRKDFEAQLSKKQQELEEALETAYKSVWNAAVASWKSGDEPKTYLDVDPNSQEDDSVGITTKVTRINVRAGIIILPVGSTKGIAKGDEFTLLRNGKQAARIKITDSQPKYCIADLVPLLHDGRGLQVGDKIKVVMQPSRD